MCKESTYKGIEKITLPVFIWSLVAWGATTFIIFLKKAPINPFLKIILSVIMFLLLVLALCSYLEVLLADHLPVPQEYRLSEEEVDKLVRERNFDKRNEDLMKLVKDKKLPIMTIKTFRKEVKFCYVCKAFKPDRAHHCSRCKRCILKMDHHCEWMSSCIGFSNYKPFLLFLFYACASILLFFIPVSYYMITDWETAKKEINLLIFYVTSLGLFIPLAGLLGYHINFVLKNQTTLENLEVPYFVKKELNEKLYDVGSMDNFREVFGDNSFVWFDPFSPGPGDGCVFPVMFQDTVHYNNSEYFLNNMDSLPKILTPKSPKFDIEKGLQKQ